VAVNSVFTYVHRHVRLPDDVYDQWQDQQDQHAAEGASSTDCRASTSKQAELEAAEAAWSLRHGQRAFLRPPGDALELCASLGCTHWAITHGALLTAPVPTLMVSVISCSTAHQNSSPLPSPCQHCPVISLACSQALAGRLPAPAEYKLYVQSNGRELFGPCTAMQNVAGGRPRKVTAHLKIKTSKIETCWGSYGMIWWIWSRSGHMCFSHF
jgi:hypothetical protein